MTLNSQRESERNPDNFFQTLWPCLKGEEIAQRREIQSIRQELKSLISAYQGDLDFIIFLNGSQYLGVPTKLYPRPPL